MKKKETYIILIFLSFMVSCITQRQIENLTLDGRLFYPYFEDGYWGYTDSEGEIVISPKYEFVDFFSNGLALVKKHGKFGYLRKDGKWHIKPQFITAHKFITNCVSVSKGSNSYYINKKGHKIKLEDCHSKESGCCMITLAISPERFVVKKDEKFEILFKYWLIKDSTSRKHIIDTTDLKIDTFYKFSHDVILLKRDKKYSFYKCNQFERKKFNVEDFDNYPPIDISYKHKQFNFVYDEIRPEIPYCGGEYIYAAARKGNKWGVVDSYGHAVVPFSYDSITFNRDQYRRSVVFVKFEENKFGYKEIGYYDYKEKKIIQGKEHFKRTHKN